MGDQLQHNLRKHVMLLAQTGHFRDAAAIETALLIGWPNSALTVTALLDEILRMRLDAICARACAARAHSLKPSR